MTNETSNNSELEKGLANREEGESVKKDGVNDNVLVCIMYVFTLILIFPFNNIAIPLIIRLF